MQIVALVVVFGPVIVYPALRRGCRAAEFVVFFDNNSVADFVLSYIVVVVDYYSLLPASLQHSFWYNPARFDRTSS